MGYRHRALGMTVAHLLQPR